MEELQFVGLILGARQVHVGTLVFRLGRQYIPFPSRIMSTHPSNELMSLHLSVAILEHLHRAPFPHQHPPNPHPHSFLRVLIEIHLALSLRPARLFDGLCRIHDLPFLQLVQLF